MSRLTASGLAAITAALLCLHLGARDLWSSHEARAAQDAQFILETGHFGLARLVDGTPDYQKPPLYYWMVAGIGWLRGGIDEVAVRLPAALSGCVTVFAVMFFLMGRGRSAAGIVAGLTLLTANHFIAIARTGRIDVPLTAAVTVAVLAWVEGHWIVTGLAIGAALLLKGPIGLMLILTIVLSWQSFDPALRLRTFAIRPMAAVGLGLAIAAPWYIAVGLETDWEFWRVFFWHHNVARAVGTAAELSTHPIWFYFLRWPIDWLPWSPVLGLALYWAVKRFQWRCDADLRLGLIWLMVVTVLLSFSRFKRADYLLPAYPGAALLLGCAAESWYRTAGRPAWWLRATAAAFACVAAGYVTYEVQWLPRMDGQWEKRAAAACVSDVKNEGDQLIFFRVEDHLLAWRIGKPIATVMEWENLDIWVGRLRPGWVMMPAEELPAWPGHITNGTLHEVVRFPDRTGRERPRTWVLCRSEPHEVGGE